MKITHLLILIFTNTICGRIFASSDSLKPKNEITIGTTGFWLPEMKGYHITGNNSFIFNDKVPVIISKLSYARQLTSDISFLVGYVGLASKPQWRYYIIRDGDNYKENYRAMIISAGISKNITVLNKLKWKASTQLSGSILQSIAQYRTDYGQSQNIYRLNSPGINLGINESFLFSSRLIVGLDGQVSFFLPTDLPIKYLSQTRIAFLLSNSVYLGVKF